MRVALVHSFYRSAQPSGENTIVDVQRDLLVARGHDVCLVARSSDDLPAGALSTATTAWNVASGHGNDPSEELSAFRPEVVHVHNLFPNFGTDWLSRWPGPLVATVHNFRPLCVNALLYRDGQVCTLCPDGRRWAGVRHGCYRGSALASAPLAWRNRRGAGADPVIKRADRLVFLSNRARDLYQRAGAPMARSIVIPNGIPDPEAAGHAAGQARFVAVGRLSAEKGFAELIAQWPDDLPLDLIGDGPLRRQLQKQAAAKPDVQLVGEVPHAQLVPRIGEYTAALFSGVNIESAYPLTAVEALATGTPVIARRGGAAAEIVAKWGGGWTFSDRRSLASALQSGAEAADMRTRARRVYEEHFRAEAWIDALEALYRSLSGHLE